jgi:hypothetical protein
MERTLHDTIPPKILSEAAYLIQPNVECFAEASTGKLNALEERLHGCQIHPKAPPTAALCNDGGGL